MTICIGITEGIKVPRGSSPVKYAPVEYATHSTGRTSLVFLINFSRLNSPEEFNRACGEKITDSIELIGHLSWEVSGSPPSHHCS